MKFKKDNTAYSEAILYPDGTRAFFLVETGHGIPAKTSRLADKVIELLNAVPEDEMKKIMSG
jgi:hypothetical protein